MREDTTIKKTLYDNNYNTHARTDYYITPIYLQLLTEAKKRQEEEEKRKETEAAVKRAREELQLTWLKEQERELEERRRRDERKRLREQEKVRVKNVAHLYNGA